LCRKWDIFETFYNRFGTAYFLILTFDNQDFIKEKIKNRDIPETRVIIKWATRHEVAQYLKSIDFAISFILPLHEKRGCSPTKMGEYFAMNVPVVVNDGVGDVREIVQNTEGGVVVKLFLKADYENAINSLLIIKDSIKLYSIRQKLKNYYDLCKGVQNYDALYRQMIG
jgi:glycosyltransferase involved in cell wall biosynthesis